MGVISLSKGNEAAYTKESLKEELKKVLDINYMVSPESASEKQIYDALSSIVVRELVKKRHDYTTKVHSEGRKQVYYISMEFLMGRSLKTSLYNLGLVEAASGALKDMGVSLSSIYEQEPDAGLGNGGLGRLAACYLDGLATDGYPATGYSILYEYGIFCQKLENGWQVEEPDNWLPGGSVWLVERPEAQIEVHFDGEIKEYWDSQYHHVTLNNYTTVLAVPYDMFVSGYNSRAVSKLRLWKAVAPAISFDMNEFNNGQFAKAVGQSILAQSISKVLYPGDSNQQGKILRLRQQYFMCAASVGDIVNHHMATYGTLDNFADKVAVQINDTHPTLAIPELMRILLDDCGYIWDKAWDIVTKTFAYTNHTVMAEALEKWSCDLLKSVVPRIFSIIVEINNRYCASLWERYHDHKKVTGMSIIRDNTVHMAKLCVCASHHVNGVSAIHSEIIKRDIFSDEYGVSPQKFTNVTNGIAYRRWLYQSNPGLCSLLNDTIGDSYLDNAMNLKKLESFAQDESVLTRLAEVKSKNKKNLSKYLKQRRGIEIDPDTIFDVQVKRLHEYKRQHLNVLNIVSEYDRLVHNPDADVTPKTYIFGAKAAPSYYMAKEIIKLIWSIGEEIKKNPRIKEKLNVVFLENYNVSLTEILMPASEISEQISLAGTEASGTGNMKFMLSGAVTLGTRDGANVEIGQVVGQDNIINFGMTVDEVERLKREGYHPGRLYSSNPVIKRVVDRIAAGFNGNKFDNVVSSLKNIDPYMVLADFGSYQEAQARASALYSDAMRWQRMSLINIANAGIFSADRAVDEYAKNIWGL
ncbi:MAG TPA: glycogen/starch/alpha-glucan phosphorylase [Candidatus Faeciplasma avium]|uniref:Alpha-1,4 glucan phosphorylase n=1 Tax=Candidatus Faeciplasma avium TaxID=2840798 RepID=A0A9D1NRW2_9FIRM|nr:glycogen/starch/alpha-glucan phosphorylase [Candidatus Faeciplasma avium]